MDANQRSALAVTRSLGKHYGTSRLVTADATDSALAGRSRYSCLYLQYPNPVHEPEAFIQWFAANCLHGRFDLVIPTSEITSQLLLMNAQRLPGLPMAFASYTSVMTLADKSNLVKSALQAQVPVPASRFYRNLAELDANDLAYPVVLKPSLSKIFTDHHWISTSVRLLQSPDDFLQVCQTDTYLASHPFMIQEFVRGRGAGLCCLYHQGQPVQFFAHTRLREKPPEGGVSVLSQAAKLDERLKGYAMKLLSSVDWHGVAMVEFRICPDGTPYLMEVNTRFWGSLQLAIDAGVDFPVQLASAFFDEPVVTNHHYRKQQRLRWLMGDLDSLYIFLKQAHPPSAKLKRVLAFCRPRFRHQKHEVNRLSDLKPFWHELKHYLKS
jgi:predicted ATP-grasp superfamily ATP-dependent carboligase